MRESLSITRICIIYFFVLVHVLILVNTPTEGLPKKNILQAGTVTANKEERVSDMNRTIEEYKNGQYALIIGINQYDNQDSLDNCVRSAVRLKKILETRYGFFSNEKSKKKRITLLKDKRATKKRIKSEFEVYKKNLKSSDNLLIYFSGHGGYNEEKKNYFWILSNGDKIDGCEIRDLINECPASHIFIIVDACKSGGMFEFEEDNETDLVETELADQLYNNLKNKSRQYLASAVEIADDYATGVLNPFSNALMVVLETNVDQFIFAGTLINRVQEIVSNNPSGLLSVGGALRMFSPKLSSAKERENAVNQWAKGQYVFFYHYTEKETKKRRRFYEIIEKLNKKHIDRDGAISGLTELISMTQSSAYTQSHVIISLREESKLKISTLQDEKVQLKKMEKEYRELENHLGKKDESNERRLKKCNDFFKKFDNVLMNDEKAQNMRKNVNEFVDVIREYMNLKTKKDFVIFISKYTEYTKDNPSDMFINILIDKSKDRINALKFYRFNFFISGDMGLGHSININNNRHSISAISATFGLGYTLPFKLRLMPYFSVSLSPGVSPTYNEYIITAELSRPIFYGIGLKIPLSGKGPNAFNFFVIQNFCLMSVRNFQGNLIDEYGNESEPVFFNFKKVKNNILSTISIGMDYNFESRDKIIRGLSFYFTISYDFSLGGRKKYELEVSPGIYEFAALRIGKAFFKMGIGFRIFFSKR